MHAAAVRGLVSRRKKKGVEKKTLSGTCCVCYNNTTTGNSGGKGAVDKNNLCHLAFVRIWAVCAT